MTFTSNCSMVWAGSPVAVLLTLESSPKSKKPPRTPVPQVDRDAPSQSPAEDSKVSFAPTTANASWQGGVGDGVMEAPNALPTTAAPSTMLTNTATPPRG